MSEDALTHIMLERHLLPVEEAKRWRQMAESENRYFEEILLREKVYSRPQLLEFLENHYFCPSLDLQDWPFDARLVSMFPQKLAARHLAFPIGLEGDSLKIAMANPDDLSARDAIFSATRHSVIPVVALRHDLKRLVDEHYERLKHELVSSERTNPTSASGTRQSKKLASSFAPVPERKKFRLDLSGKSAVEIVDEVIRVAGRIGASDIHFQPGQHEMAVRFRLDGILQTVYELTKEISPSVVSRVKILGRMDVSERRIPQDGRHTVENPDSIFDLRISTLPCQFGEKVVIRLLTKSMELLDLENLKMPPALRHSYQEVIDNPQGFFLVAGPTGSGKTTTLYATLNGIDREAVNVITLEDPIEYSLPKVAQVQINEEVGLTFAGGLRSILRQDPDVVLVGEIRDADTVSIACRAALTGHKVLSTIHTNDSAQAITRLLDMGTPPYLVSATLRGVLSQRLVRLVCAQCKGTYPATDTELAVLGYPKIKELTRGSGCGHCNHTGYKGRMAIYEYLRLEDNLHRLILDRASPYTIRHAAQRNGMVLMADYAKRAVLEGLTTVAEIQRVVLNDDGQEQVCQNCQRVVSMEFAVCPYCQHVLKEKCRRCGNPVDGSWEACPNCGEEIEREWKKQHCQHCLAIVDPAWDLCPFCGGEPN